MLKALKLSAKTTFKTLSGFVGLSIVMYSRCVGGPYVVNLI